MVFFQKLVYFTSNIRHIGILLVSLTLPETLVVKFAVYAIYIYGQASHKESKRGFYCNQLGRGSQVNANRFIV